MRKLYFVVLLIISQIHFLCGQNLSSDELIKAWKISDKTQTIEAEKTYDDLRVNYNLEKFNQLYSELNAHLKKKPDLRFAIRIGIYDLLGRHTDDSQKYLREEKIRKLFKQALSLKDKQLLSEVYTLYANQGPGNEEDRLFYNINAVEIQNKIGAEYFPKLYLRYLSMSSSYFTLDDYTESIVYGFKCLNLLKNQKLDIYAYSIQYDLLGYSYYELNQPDSGIYYYQKLKEILHDKSFDAPNYKPLHENEKELRQIWNGVTDGGIARGLIAKGKYNQAILLLEKNIVSSEKFDQELDLIKAKNLIASAFAHLGQNEKAIKYWYETIASAKNLPKGNRYLISATQGLSDTYKSLNRFDSAYHYIVQNQNYERIREEEISQSRLHSVNARFEFEKLGNQIKSAEFTIQKQKNNRNLILAGSFGAFFILLIFYNKHRFKQKLKFKNLESQQKISELQKQRIEDELNVARSNIKVFIDKVNEKNELIENISAKLDEFNKIHSLEKKELEETLNELRHTKIITDEDWINFQSGFDKIYAGFSKNLVSKFPSITPSEQRYLMLSKIGLNHKEMARALGISNDSVRVTWNRVRNKIGGTLQDTPNSIIEKI